MNLELKCIVMLALNILDATSEEDAARIYNDLLAEVNTRQNNKNKALKLQ